MTQWTSNYDALLCVHADLLTSLLPRGIAVRAVWPALPAQEPAEAPPAAETRSHHQHQSALQGPVGGLPAPPAGMLRATSPSCRHAEGLNHADNAQYSDWSHGDSVRAQSWRVCVVIWEWEESGDEDSGTVKAKSRGCRWQECQQTSLMWNAVGLGLVNDKRAADVFFYEVSCGGKGKARRLGKGRGSVEMCWLCNNEKYEARWRKVQWMGTDKAGWEAEVLRGRTEDVRNILGRSCNM